MANFNAGAIESTLTLDRSPFVSGLNAARLQVRRFRDSYGEIDVEMDVQMDETSYERARYRLDDLTEDRSAEIEVGVDSGLARLRIAEISRPRRMNLFINVVNIGRVRGMLESLGRITLSLSGANVVQNRLRAIREQLENLDQVAYGLGGLTYLIGNLSNIGLTGLANITTLIGSMGALGGGLIPLPAMLTSLATSVGAVAIAFTGWDTDREVRSMQDMQDVIGRLQPAWEDLTRAVRIAFWEDLADPFEDLANRLLPTLQDGLVSTADSLNGAARQWMDALGGIDLSVWENMFEGISSSIDIANGAIEPLVNAFVTLGSVGSDNLDRLAEWWVRMAERFDAFITGAAEDGRLQEWIDNAATAFGDLATILGQFGGVLNGITDAFAAAGSTTLGTLADTMTRIHEIVDSPAFQEGLTTIFEGVIAGAGALNDALGPIGEAIGRMAPTISYLAEQVGVVLADALVAVADALATPAFQEGLRGFFDGLAAGIQGFLPYLPDIAAGFGAIGEVMGEVLANVGPILGEVLAGLGDAIVAISPQLIELADLLGGALLETVQILAPAMEPLLTAIADLAVAMAPLATELVLALAEGIVILVDALGPIVEALLPVIEAVAELAPMMGDLVVLGFEAIAKILERLEPLWPVITEIMVDMFERMAESLPLIVELVEAMLPFVGAILEPLMALMPSVIELWREYVEVMEPLQPIFVDLIESMVQLMQDIGPIIDEGLPVMIDLVNTLSPLIFGFARIGLGALSTALGFAQGAIENVTTVFGRLEEGVRNARETISTMVENITRTFEGIKSRVQSAFAGARNWLKDAARNIIDGFIGGITGAFGRVREAFNGLTARIPDWKGPRERDRTLLQPAGRLIMGGLIRSVQQSVPDLRRTLGRVTDEFRLGSAGLSATLDARGPGVATAAGTAGLMDLVNQAVQGQGGPLIGQLTLQARPDESIDSQFDTALFRARVARRELRRTSGG